MNGEEGRGHQWNARRDQEDAVMFYICSRSGRALFGPFVTWDEAEGKLAEYPSLSCVLNIKQRKPLKAALSNSDV